MLRPTLLALLITPAAALAAEYEGRWAENPAWCANTRAGGTDEMPLTITRRSIETFASSCRVVAVTRRGAAWWLRTRCRDEGQSEREPRVANTFVLRVDGNRLTLRDSAGIQNLTRCAR
jgi:hypothetical protein